MTLDFLPFETTVLESLMRERLMAMLSGFFGLLAVDRRRRSLWCHVLPSRATHKRNRHPHGARRCASVAVAQAGRAMLFGLKPTDSGVLGTAIAGMGFIAF
jgi:hypothetical protein